MGSSGMLWDQERMKCQKVVLRSRSGGGTVTHLTTSKTFTKKINSIYKSTVLYLRNIKIMLSVCFYKFEIKKSVLPKEQELIPEF